MAKVEKIPVRFDLNEQLAQLVELLKTRGAMTRYGAWNSLNLPARDFKGLIAHAQDVGLIWELDGLLHAAARRGSRLEGVPAARPHNGSGDMLVSPEAIRQACRYELTADERFVIESITCDLQAVEQQQLVGALRAFAAQRKVGRLILSENLDYLIEVPA